MVDKQALILQSIQTRTTTRSLADSGFDSVTFYVNEQKRKKNKANKNTNTNTNSNKKQKVLTDPWLGKRVRSIFNPREKETSKKCLQRRVESLLLFLESPEENITDVINDTTTSSALREIERIKEQAMYLRLVYQNALDNMYIGATEGWTW